MTISHVTCDQPEDAATTPISEVVRRPSFLTILEDNGDIKKVIVICRVPTQAVNQKL